MRSTPQGVAAALSELATLADDIDQTNTKLRGLYDRRTLLWLGLRGANDTGKVDVSWTAIADASRVAAPLVHREVRKARA